MNTIPETEHGKIWGYRWECVCGHVIIKTMPTIPQCVLCRKPMTHVAPPVKR